MTARGGIGSLYGAHVAERRRRAEAALAAAGFDSLVLGAGTPMRYFADDQDAPFRPNAHFAHWTPIEGPHHLLSIRPGRKPRLIRVVPEDYWVEAAPLGDPFWTGEFEIEEVPDEASAWKRVETNGRTAFVGDAAAAARAHGIADGAILPPALLARLDWDRSLKSPYEVACVEEANRSGARGHLAARKAFEGGGSELEIHRAFVEGAGCVDRDLPYETIVGLDEKGATLHYTGKRTTRGGRVLLLDAGARRLGYASDITRTWTTAACEPAFRGLVDGLDRAQRDLCERVKPGTPYPDLHRAAHAAIGDLLRAAGVLRLGGEEAVEAGLTAPFFPHGLGHFLGIQVHDVAGHQKEPAGGTVPPPAAHPFLRTTRTIEEGMLFTVEPGIYFIPMLLRKLRAGPRADAVDWALVDRLVPCGGIRIEDNVVVTRDGHRNLTRPFV